jgi:hypothetical protein
MGDNKPVVMMFLNNQRPDDAKTIAEEVNMKYEGNNQYVKIVYEFVGRLRAKFSRMNVYEAVGRGVVYALFGACALAFLHTFNEGLGVVYAQFGNMWATAGVYVVNILGLLVIVRLLNSAFKKR